MILFLLKSIGLKNIYLTNDVVYELKDKIGSEALEKITSEKKVGIVIAPLILKSNEKQEKYKKSIIEYINSIKSKKIDITLIPFQYEYDINLLKEINNEVNVKICDIGKDNMWEIIREFKKQDLIIGMRFHSVVLSLILNIPTIPIIYHSKVYSAVKEFELEGVAQGVGDGSNWINEDIDSKKMAQDTFNMLSKIEYEKLRIKNILNNKENKNKIILEKFINDSRGII